MKIRFILQSLACFILLFTIAVYSGRLLEPLGGIEVDFVGHSPTSLTAKTRNFIDHLEGKLAITFFVSPRERMPSHLKQVEGEVRALLEALWKAAPGRINTRVLYPELSGAIGIAYAARRKISPVSVRRIDRDEHSEEKVWSALVLTHENGEELLIEKIEDADLPFMEEWVLAHLKTLTAPPQPSFAFAAPRSGGFDEFPQFLSQHGPVIQIDFDRSPYIPPDTDILFLLAPQRITDQHIRQLQRYLATGRAAVVAGSTYAPRYVAEGDSVLFRMVEQSAAWTDLLRPFGLRPLPDLLMDRNTGSLPVQLEDGTRREVEAPFHLRNLPAFRDFRRFRTPARGGLSFVAASALEVNPHRTRQAGYDAQVIATTTEHAWVQRLSNDVLSANDLQMAFTVPKQNLMVLLSPTDRWAGPFVAMASASTFGDGMLRQPGYGHSVLLNDLVRTFASRDRLIRSTVDRRAPPELSPLSFRSRVWWRAVVIFLVPTLLLAFGWWRHGRSGDFAILRTLTPALWMRTVAAAFILVVALASGAVAALAFVDIDLTAETVNTPSTQIVEILRKTKDDLTVEHLLSHRANLPAHLKTIGPRIAKPFASAGVDFKVVRPDAVLDTEPETFAETGLQPFEVEVVRHDTVVSQSVWSALRLSLGQSQTVIPRLDDQTATHIDFLTAAALHRLHQGEAPLVSVISDLPRLSPAEALEDYQKKGLSAPSGTDVYSLLKRRMADYGYRVHHVNPRYPRLADESDVVVWLQPRRDSSEIIQQLSRYLASGGYAIVAMQHFNIQQRQYRGIGFQTVYWPQPQFQDFDRYLRLFGVEQVRQVLMDRTRHHLKLATQVNRTAVREYDAQEVALPFLIRTVNERYNTESPMTSNLGDLLFIWGNSFDLSGLPSSIEQHVLIRTSPESWSYAWKGGWLPPESLTPTAVSDNPQVLAVDLRGRFPEADFVEDEEGKQKLEATRSGSRDGRLVLLGNSEMFKNQHLDKTGFDHSQLILNLLADAAYDEDMTRLQARSRQARGFAYHDPSGRTVWRLIVIACGPLALGTVAWFRHRRRNRPAKSTNR